MGQFVATWNCARGQDVFVQDKRGDTSGHTTAISLQQVLTVSALCDLPAKKRPFTLGGRLWLFWSILLVQIEALQATSACDTSRVALCLDDYPTATVNIPDCGRDVDFQRVHSTWSVSSECLQIGPLVTLLEEAKDDGFDLVCQTVTDALSALSCFGSARSRPVQLSLEDTIPCTAFQTAVQELQDVLPARKFVDFSAWQDWLDCDLQAVHGACKSCPAIWDWLTHFGSWYDRPFDPEAVHIYTDGSTCQANSEGSATASWAFNVWALAGTTQAYLGHSYGVTVPEGSPFHLGEVREDALTGEQLALAWALSWTIEASCAFRCACFVIHFDNQAAGFGGFGSYRLPTDEKTSRPTRLSHSVAVLRQCAQAVCTVIGRHVPSHSGFAGNELADVLAKLANRLREPEELVSRPYWPSLVTKHALSSWAWLALSNQSDLPALGAFESEARRLFQEAAVRPFTFYVSEREQRIEGDSGPDTIGVQLRLCSLNVLSLREYDNLPQGLAVVGKRALLKQQFLRQQLHVVALQETRIQGDSLLPDADFVMLHSSCSSQGCFGCAIWLSKTLPVVVTTQKVHYFTKEVCTVLAADPRLLIVQVDLPGFAVTFVSAHAPYDGHKSQCAGDFWRSVGDVVSSRPSGAQLVVLADSNGHLGSISSPSVGTAGAESENQSGAAFHAFLLEFGLCLPSTYEEIHHGQHFTWRAGSPSGHRLDYVAVPEEWFVGQLASSVWTDFDHLHDVDDHQPVLLFCELVRRSTQRCARVAARAPRPRADTDPGQLQCFDYALGTLPLIDWHVDVDMHYAAFAKSTLWCWSETVQSVSRQRCKPFVSDDTLTAIEHRKQVRRYIAFEADALSRTRKLIGIFAFWLAWQHAEPTGLQVQYLYHALQTGRFHIASAVCTLGRLRLSLRKAIRSDRAVYLRRLADEVASTTLQQPKQLFAAVYKAFPVVRSKRRSGFCPLPAVLLENGERAKTLDERMQRWTEHFAAQEGGTIVSAEEYDREVLLQAPLPDNVPDFDILCVPTLLDIEQDVLRLRNGKAAGPDLITADLLKLNVPNSSRRLLPVFTKAALACREPVVFKGGCLITLAKKAHASLQCSDFRSIILSSVPGKLFHRSLRRRLLQPLSRIAFPLQAGALPGASPEILALYLTAFQRWAQSTRQYWAVTFFDVKQAYYRTLRQLVVDCDSDAGLCKILYDLGLPEQAIGELRDLLHRAASTSPLAGKEHLTAMLRDLLTATWFKFEASSLLAVTHKGTRPGDPAADVLFAFTLSALFKSIEDGLESQGLVDSLPHVQQDPFVDGYHADPCLQFVSWADDFARPFVGSSASELIDKVRRATKCCTEKASACGIELTFGADKTAVVCDPSAVHFLHEAGDDVLGGGIAFYDAVADKRCVLPVVHAYKHLGGIFNSSAKPDLEIFMRRAAALGPLRPVRSKLFASRAVPLATRRTLLYALGLARFVHGSGALHLNQKGHQRTWNSTYVGIWAHLVPYVQGSKPHSLHVLSVSKAPPPHLFLALQRAAILDRLVSRQFVAITHMLQLEWEAASYNSWLAQIIGDIQTVAQWAQAAGNLEHSCWPLHELFRQCLAAPAWWPSVVRQAFKAYAADVVSWKAQPRILSVPDGGDFKCHICHNSFAQRSFLSVHLARKHMRFAPARHFAPSRQCVACLRTFSTVMLVQAHLRRNPKCLRRAVWLMEPLDFEEIKEAESFDKQTQRKVTHGAWQRRCAVEKVRQGEGPFNITAVDVELCPENFSIAVVARHFRPKEDVALWIEQYLSCSTRSGPRQQATSWWHIKPSLLNSFCSSFFNLAGAYNMWARSTASKVDKKGQMRTFS